MVTAKTRNKKNNFNASSLDDKTSLNNYLEDFVGQKIALLCMRYQYRGVLAKVLDNAVVLANATAVESSGSPSLDAPQHEDPINGTIVIKTDVIEIAYQPNWCFADLPGEK